MAGPACRRAGPAAEQPDRLTVWNQYPTQRARPEAGMEPGFGQTLVVAGGFLIGPDRGISFCAVVDPSNLLVVFK
jgi:hypothetical protein